MAKRPRSSGWDLKPSSSLPSPAGHNSERNRGQEKEDHHVSVRDRFEGSSSGVHSSGRHGWGPLPRDTNGSPLSRADCKLYVSFREPSNSEQRRTREEYSRHPSPLRSVPLPDLDNTNTRRRRPSRFDSGPSRPHPGQRIRSNEVLPAKVEVTRSSEWESMDQSGGDGPDWSCISPVQRSSGCSERVRSNQEQPTTVEVPRANEWEAIEQSKDDGPDWSCISPVHWSSGCSKRARSNQEQLITVEVPRVNEWESIEQSKDDGPDWSCLSPVQRSWGPSSEVWPTMLEVPRSSKWESTVQLEDDRRDWSCVSPVRRPCGPSEGIRSNEPLPTTGQVPRSSKRESAVQSGKSSGPSERVRSNGRHSKEVLGASEWESSVQYKDDGPDWSCISPVKRSSYPRERMRRNGSVADHGGGFQDTSRDRSCKSRRVRSFEEVACQSTDAERERLLVLKHSKLSKVDYKTPSSYKSPTQYKGWRPTEET